MGRHPKPFTCAEITQTSREVRESARTDMIGTETELLETRLGGYSPRDRPNDMARLSQGAEVAEQTIRFEDGAGYEQMMGIWSRLVGEVFLQWLAPPPGLRWIDVAAAMGPSPSCWLSDPPLWRWRGLIRPKGSSPSLAHDPRPKWQSLPKAMPWHSPSPLAASMQPSWRWSWYSFPTP